MRWGGNTHTNNGNAYRVALVWKYEALYAFFDIQVRAFDRAVAQKFFRFATCSECAALPNDRETMRVHQTYYTIHQPWSRSRLQTKQEMKIECLHAHHHWLSYLNPISASMWFGAASQCWDHYCRMNGICAQNRRTAHVTGNSPLLTFQWRRRRGRPRKASCRVII